MLPVTVRGGGVDDGDTQGFLYVAIMVVYP